ncbi:ornithine cyclodeaminase family protein [Polycladidibacter hongkongensis]|uniref:ornithine cyclodeaminase family protein n=1 Tax=Polycladidibacter hongkongensis TaxID=1647556 RepID=UPI000831243F|nr:ornithine cyclodeaminase [Pseudovibrio hongkongensis]
MTNSIRTIGFAEGEEKLDWLELIAALERGHALPKATISDSFLYRGKDTLLQRQAWIDGLGIGVKSATIFPGNAALGKPAINGAMSLYDDCTGELRALIDFHLVTKWKTAGDSLLAASRLARKDSRVILILGAGAVAHNLRQAYEALFPKAEFLVWNRTQARAQQFADKYTHTQTVSDLAGAVGQADIITSALMVQEPVLRGEWLKPGQHVDLIGAYRPDMREADDTALRRSSIFVDSYDTTLEHIGELKIPLASGAISKSDVLGDYYTLAQMQRRSDDEITLFKNGGGAHLDLMVAAHIVAAFED